MIKEHRLQAQVCEIQDIQATVRDIRRGLSGDHKDPLQERLDELDRKSDNLELYGLSMLELKREVSSL